MWTRAFRPTGIKWSSFSQVKYILKLYSQQRYFSMYNVLPIGSPLKSAISKSFISV
ncbi:hypothetical protein IQ22_03331 [Pseudomonas duriflava]|uniref:Uncharacterized protein n=1 Tax=Pseudomonas duriflava TaxID=459528 RepID=A0A562Q720_9PSED|nr:hypothetical protein IQ22_03331 [Pseudomonas duriflava]